MSIPVHCEHCGKSMKVKDSLEGQLGLCPFCNSQIQVPFVASEQVGVKEEPKPEVKPPTEKQLDFARDLGVNIPAGTNRKELSHLIDEAREDAPASESQKEFLRQLGVSVPDNIRSKQMSLLLDTALNLKYQVQEQVHRDYDRQLKSAGMLLEGASETQLLKELRNRGHEFFLFLMKDAEFRYKENVPMSGELFWTDDLTEGDVRWAIMMLDKEWNKKFDLQAYADDYDGKLPRFKYKA